MFVPLYEWRTGFPWSAVDEFQDFVGERNRSGRLPSISSLDFTLARPLRFKKYRFTGGIKIYNAFNSGNERDVQANITSPDYGKFYNPIERSIGFVVSSSKPCQSHLALRSRGRVGQGRSALQGRDRARLQRG